MARAVRIYASELLDKNTCDECRLVDGKEYPDLEAAERDYPTGGYAHCHGRERCRGTLVAVYEETPPPEEAEVFVPPQGGPGGGQLRTELETILAKQRRSGLTQEQMARRAEIIEQLRANELARYEARAGRIVDQPSGVTSLPPVESGGQFRDAAGVLQERLGTVRQVRQPNKRTRDMWVVDDDRTLANNQLLRQAEDVDTEWLQSVDRYVGSSEVTAEGSLYRGAMLSPESVASLQPGATYTERAFMAVTPDEGLALTYADLRKLDQAMEGTFAQTVLFELRVPAGQRLGVMDVSEFVLPRETTIRILGIEREEGVFRVVAEIA